MEKGAPCISKGKIFLSLLFVPGVYIVLLLSAVLTIAIGGGVIAGISYICVTYLPVIPTGILFLIGLGSFIGVLGSLKAILSTFKRTKSFEPAMIITMEEHPKLNALVIELAKKMNTKIPDTFILHSKSNFFVANGKIQVLNGVAKGRIMSISTPLLSVLSVNEFRSVIAHEFAHFTGNDTLYSKTVLPIYKGAHTLKQEISNVVNNASENSGFVSIPLFLPLLLVSLYLNAFQKWDMKLSRSREYRADYISASICGKSTFTNALRKAIVIGDVFDSTVDNEILDILQKDKIFVNYFAKFRQELPKFKRELQETEANIFSQQEEVYSSHPPFSARIESLPFTEGEYQESNSNAAINLLENSSSIEEELTKTYSYFIWDFLKLTLPTNS